MRDYLKRMQHVGHACESARACAHTHTHTHMHSLPSACHCQTRRTNLCCVFGAQTRCGEAVREDTLPLERAAPLTEPLLCGDGPQASGKQALVPLLPPAAAAGNSLKAPARPRQPTGPRSP
uniref:Uncharacterized protein n=1 Tax=Pipistrellus kuhlii TaxID=59472 RepID=A0A7J7VBI3_PIPKU|nr:hypothetical protein mPipKuh1_008535 [Pipistrellus kuhlii]